MNITIFSSFYSSCKKETFSKDQTRIGVNQNQAVRAYWPKANGSYNKLKWNYDFKYCRPEVKIINFQLEQNKIMEIFISDRRICEWITTNRTFRYGNLLQKEKSFHLNLKRNYVILVWKISLFVYLITIDYYSLKTLSENIK